MFKRKDVQIILWLTFITVAAWIGFHIYHVSVTSTISEEIQTQIAPVHPNFDTDTINKLKAREQVEPLYQYRESAPEISVTPPEITVTTSPEITVTPAAETLISPTESISPTVTGTQ